MVTLYDENMVSIPVKFWSFPGGERGCRIESPLNSDRYRIKTIFKNSDDLMDTFLLTDAIRRDATGDPVRIDLEIPYFPYARQDRKSAWGESHSLRVVADLINRQNYSNVFVADPHSDVVEAVVNNIKLISQDTLFEIKLRELGLYNELYMNSMILLAPDAGAQKKIFKCSSRLQIPAVTASKTRDPITGIITGCSIDPESKKMLYQKNVWVVDDIIDGGRTFVELAKIIDTPVLSFNLYATHGIFSKGKHELNSIFNKVASFYDYSM